MSTPHDDPSPDASQDPAAGDAGSAHSGHEHSGPEHSGPERAGSAGGSGYDHVRDDFNRLRFEEQASFLVEAAVSVAARGIETVGRTLASELEDLFDEANARGPHGRADASHDAETRRSPGPAEPETAQTQSRDAPSSDAPSSDAPSSGAPRGDADTDEAAGDDSADPDASARPDEPIR